MNLRPLILLIHGVGNPGKGEIEAAVTKNLKDGEIHREVVEINWNSIVAHPVKEGRLRSRSIAELAAGLATAIVIGADTATPSARSATDKLLLALQAAAFSLCEVALASWFVLAIFAPLGALLVGLIGESPDRSRAPP